MSRSHRTAARLFLTALLCGVQLSSFVLAQGVTADKRDVLFSAPDRLEFRFAVREVGVSQESVQQEFEARRNAVTEHLSPLGELTSRDRSLMVGEASLNRLTVRQKNSSWSTSFGRDGNSIPVGSMALTESFTLVVSLKDRTRDDVVAGVLGAFKKAGVSPESGARPDVGQLSEARSAELTQQLIEKLWKEIQRDMELRGQEDLPVRHLSVSTSTASSHEPGVRVSLSAKFGEGEELTVSTSGKGKESVALNSLEILASLVSTDTDPVEGKNSPAETKQAFDRALAELDLVSARIEELPPRILQCPGEIKGDALEIIQKDDGSDPPVHTYVARIFKIVVSGQAMKPESERLKEAARIVGRLLPTKATFSGGKLPHEGFLQRFSSNRSEADVPSVRFAAPVDAEAAEVKALELAHADARRQATFLANLLKRELGEPKSLRVTVSDTDTGATTESAVTAECRGTWVLKD